MSNYYFDFHVHLLAKQYLSLYDPIVPNKDREVKGLSKNIDLSKDFMRIVDNEILHLLQSQCSIDQVNEGKVQFVVANLVGLEFAYGASKGFFSKIFKSKLTDPLDKTYFQKVEDGEISYVNMFLRELALYRKLKENGDLQFACRHGELADYDQNKPIVLFGIEGGHMLSMRKIGNSAELDPMKEYESTDKNFKTLPQYEAVKALGSTRQKNPAEILKTLCQEMRKEGMDVLCLNLTHLSHIHEQDLATHAFGLKMLKQAVFYPVGNGITELGRSVVDSAYAMKNEKGESCPVYIDIKHMSLKSRQDLYRIRKAKGFDHLPVLATHVGVTGYSINEWKDAIKEKSLELHKDQGVTTVKFKTDRKVGGHWGSVANRNFTFNPWSINLMDEDVIEIMASGGLVGFILDIRVLGHQARVKTPGRLAAEYMSVAEFGSHFPQINVTSLERSGFEAELAEEESYALNTKNERHPLMLSFNIIHAIIVGELSDRCKKDKAWKHICIGSDFDGLINPVKVCRNSTDMPKLESNLMRWLPIAAKEYQNENGGGNYLYEDFYDRVKLKEIVRGIMYENGVEFLQDIKVLKAKDLKKIKDGEIKNSLYILKNN